MTTATQQLEQTPRPRLRRPPSTGINPAVVLDDFILNSSELRAFHLAVVDRLARVVAASWNTPRPIREITLVGHTDISGSSPYNLVLGRRRGLSVRSRLQTSLANA